MSILRNKLKKIDNQNDMSSSNMISTCDSGSSSTSSTMSDDEDINDNYYKENKNGTRTCALCLDVTGILVFEIMKDFQDVCAIRTFTKPYNEEEHKEEKEEERPQTILLQKGVSKKSKGTIIRNPSSATTSSLVFNNMGRTSCADDADNSTDVLLKDLRKNTKCKKGLSRRSSSYNYNSTAITAKGKLPIESSSLDLITRRSGSFAKHTRELRLENNGNGTHSLLTF
jgi:hypothetical protein